MMKKLFKILLLLFVCAFTNVNARSNGYVSLEQYGNTTLRNSLTVQGINVSYYREFVNLHDALTNFKEIHSDVINYIKDTYLLDGLSLNNWKQYFYIVKSESLPFDKSEIFMMNAFFDIFENSEENKKIDNIIKELRYTYSNKLEKINKLQALLPSPENDLLKKAYQTSPFSSQSFNVINGVNYAEKYAWSPNSTKYGYLDPDDTNFASQILENGGYNHSSHQIYGWWYNSLSGYLIDCGDAWRYPNSFVNYFGTKNGYQRNFQIFSQNVERGDFIAIDIAGDGSYDRIGFVTYKSNTLKQYTISQGSNTSTAIFNDFIIAQHSNNYNSWVSEDVNDWEYGILTRARYAIVNINKI